MKKSAMMQTKPELKVTIAKLIEIAYLKDEGLTTKIIKEGKYFKIKVNQNGKVTRQCRSIDI